MKEFFTHMLATIAGVLVAGMVFVIIGVVCLIGIVAGSTSSPQTEMKDNSVFVLRLEGSLTERSTEDPISLFMGDEYGAGLDDILSAIRKAKESKQIKGIHLSAGNFACSPASMQAIRNALLDFKKSGKFLTAYGDNYTQGTYYIASVADKLIINPSGNIQWHGLSAQTLFYKNLLDKLGVEMQIFRVGTYKSAVEPYTSTQMSEANKEQTQAFISSIWNQILTDVSVSRHIPVGELNALADKNMDYQPAQTYLKAGLADTLMYKDQVEDYLKNLTQCKADDDLKSLNLEAMTNVAAPQPAPSDNTIAVYYAYGEIDGAGSSYNGIDSETMASDLRKLRKDKDVKAVVIRVNSPGGSAFGSEQIWREVALLKAEKPVVVSMGDYAASGGYYISCAAHKIVAEPTTLTGSIGIFGMVPNAKGLVQDKLGIKPDGVKTNRLSDMGSPYRPFNEDEKSLMQNMVNNGYELFVKRCAEGRHLPTDSIRKIAEGRVWTGRMAKKLHLVDELGGIDRALKIAASMAGIKDFGVSNYPEKEDLLTSLMNFRIGRYIQSKVRTNLGDYYDGFYLLHNLEKADCLQARMPFLISIH